VICDGLLYAVFWSGLAFMKSGYNAIIKEDGGWWIGWVEEIPGVNAQERTKEDLMESLREALKDILNLNREDARKAVVEGFMEVSLEK